MQGDEEGNFWSVFGWNSSVRFPHTNGPFPSVSKRKEPFFYSRNGRRTERNGSNRTGSWLSLSSLSGVCVAIHP